MRNRIPLMNDWCFVRECSDPSVMPDQDICGKRYAQRAGGSTQIRVYSNQPTVTLYLNGAAVGSLTAEKVFVFEVALQPGMNTLLAQAGDVWDTAVLERVDQEPAIYTLPSVKMRHACRKELLRRAAEKPAVADLPLLDEKLSDLISRPEYALSLNQALTVVFRLGEFGQGDVQSFLSRIGDVSLRQLQPLQADPELFDALKRVLADI